MTTDTKRQSRQLLARGRGPVLPPFAFALVDRALGTRRATVLDVRAETPTIFSLRLERPPGFTYSAGQHAIVRLATQQGPDMRPLSIASMPEADELEFATRSGPSAFKQAFLRLRPGDHLKVSRPMGTFAFDPQRPAVMVAGGIGITPLRSMLLTLAKTHRVRQPVRLLFANRSLDEVPYRTDLERLADQHSQLRITWVLRDVPATSPRGEVLAGRIDHDLLSRVAAEHPEAMYYVTGPTSMVTDMATVIRDIGVPKSRIRQAKQTFPLSR